MSPQYIRVYLKVAAFLLLVTGIAKIISIAGKAQILLYPDPIFGISFRLILGIAGAVELCIAFVCFCKMRPELPASLVAWLATSLFAYRFGLNWIHWERPCRCLGNLTDALHFSPETADLIMRVVLSYLFIGSYAILFLLWRQRGKAFTSASNGESL
jgi:hypothetical protein